MATQDDAPQTVFDRQYGSRAVLALLAEKWTTMVLFVLAGGTKRHGELRREIAGISQKMLTQTLRRLERNGLVARTLYPQVPPARRVCPDAARPDARRAGLRDLQLGRRPLRRDRGGAPRV
jgi:DNA-binding HxlR family transcriptional regulator